MEIDIDTNEDNDTRNIFLTDDISQSSVDAAIQSIIEFNQEDDKGEAEKVKYKREVIKVYISSEGGCVYAGFGLTDIIRSSKTTVHTYCIGQAMSAGLMIFCAGHKRIMYKYSTLMFHSVANGAIGKLQTIVEITEETKRVQRQYDDIVVGCSKVTRAKLAQVVKAKSDWFISSEEAVKLKLCDEVL